MHAHAKRTYDIGLFRKVKPFWGNGTVFRVCSVEKLAHAIFLVALLLIANSTNAQAAATADCNDGSDTTRQIRACTQLSRAP